MCIGRRCFDFWILGRKVLTVDTWAHIGLTARFLDDLAVRGTQLSISRVT